MSVDDALDLSRASARLSIGRSVPRGKTARLPGRPYVSDLLLSAREIATVSAHRRSATLTNRLERFRVLHVPPDVNIRSCGNPLDGGIVERAHGARRRSDDERLIGKFLALGNQRAGADKAVIADARPVEHDRPHPDQAVGADRAAVQDDVVADDAVRSDGHGKTGIGMQRRIILDLGPRAELDPFVIAAQDRTKPDAGIGFQPYLPDEGRRRRYPITAFLRQFWMYSVQFVNHACLVAMRRCSQALRAQDRKLAALPQAAGSPARPAKIAMGPKVGITTCATNPIWAAWGPTSAFSRGR